MYKKFFRMEKDPFALHPSPETFFHSTSHDQAWQALKESVLLNEPFIMVSGEYGVGKTLLCLKLCQFLESEADYKFVLVPSLWPYSALLTNIARALKLKDQFASCTTAAELEERFFTLYSSRKHRQSVTIIIDDLQDYPREALIQLKKLCNFHQDGFYPFRIICFAHSNFVDELSQDKDFIPFIQRFRKHFRITPLPSEELKEYIYFRLFNAGAKERPYFDRQALNYIAQKSKGIPRLINNLCDRILIEASDIRTDRINLALAQKADGAFPEANIPAPEPTPSPSRTTPAPETSRPQANKLNINALIKAHPKPDDEQEQHSFAGIKNRKRTSRLTLLFIVNTTILFLIAYLLFSGTEAIAPSSKNMVQLRALRIVGKSSPTSAQQKSIAPSPMPPAVSEHQSAQEVTLPPQSTESHPAQKHRHDRPFSLLLSKGNLLSDVSWKVEVFKEIGIAPLYLIEGEKGLQESSWSIAAGNFASKEEALNSTMHTEIPGATIGYFPYTLLVTSGASIEDVEEVKKMLLADGYLPWVQQMPNGRIRLLLGAYASRAEAGSRAQLLLQEGIRATVVSK